MKGVSNVPSLPVTERRTDEDGRTYRVRAGTDEPRYYDLCEPCQTFLHTKVTFFPPHVASRRCESGRRPHCSCDRCF